MFYTEQARYINIMRKFKANKKCGHTHKWYVVKRNETDLEKLEGEWDCVQLQAVRKLDTCLTSPLAMMQAV